jgi:exonuclease III
MSLVPKNSKCPCITCCKNVNYNQKALYCDSCSKWIHLKCTTLTLNDYAQLATEPSDWFCTKCLSSLFPFNAIEDDFDFLCCLYNLAYSNKPNASLIKNSQQLKLTNKYKVCNNDIDPDKYFYKNFNNLGNIYYLEDEFNQLLIDKSIDSNFSLLHINIRSLSKNLEQLTIYLNSLNHRFTVIALSETWANENNQLTFSIPGYNSVMVNRTDGRGGGVALFILDTVSFIKRTDLSMLANADFECVFVELTNVQFGNKIVGAVYHPPGRNLDLFNTGFEAVLNLISKSKAEYLIAGDFNIDLLKHDTHEGTELFINNMFAHSLIPTITRPTRFGKNSSSLIDNIFTNKPNEASTSGMLISDISDHLPIFYISKSVANNNLPKYTTINYRPIADDKIQKLKTDLQKIDWSYLQQIGDVNLVYGAFLDKFNELYDSIMPLTQKRVKIYSNSHKPWITTGIVKSIRCKNLLYKLYKK